MRTILQSGKDKHSCSVCGMKLPMFYKTNHAATHQDKTIQYCSIHCLVDEIKNNKKQLQNIKVVDNTTLRFIDATKAYYVVGSKKKGTMSIVSKYAFGSKDEALKFSKRYGGEVLDFEKAKQIALKDFK